MKKLFFITVAIATVAFTGCNRDNTYKLYYASGNLAQILHFSDAMHNGKAIRFRDDAQQIVWEAIDFTNNKKEGKWLKYFENGQMMTEQEYSNDILNGASTEWYASGQIKSLKHFKNGKLDGECLAWFEDGATKSESVYSSGQLAEDKTNHIVNSEIAQLVTANTHQFVTML